MKNLEPLAIFVRIAEMGSFTRAADSLGIRKGRASNVVRELEAQMGYACCTARPARCS